MLCWTLHRQGVPSLHLVERAAIECKMPLTVAMHVKIMFFANKNVGSREIERILRKKYVEQYSTHQAKNVWH